MKNKFLPFVFFLVFAASLGYAEVIEGISYGKRVEFEKQVHKKWEEATTNERAQFLSGKHKAPSKTSSTQKKNPASTKSIFENGQAKKAGKTQSLKTSHRSMGGY